MQCKRCRSIVPKERAKLGYDTCVSCSTEERWGCSHLVFHKTGNTIEIIKDPDLCERINEMAKRPRFGICNGMKGVYKKKKRKEDVAPKKLKSVAPQRVLSRKKPDPSSYQFDAVGKEALAIMEQGTRAVEEFLGKCVRELRISPDQKTRIEKVVRYMKINS